MAGDREFMKDFKGLVFKLARRLGSLTMVHIKANISDNIKFTRLQFNRSWHVHKYYALKEYVLCIEPKGKGKQYGYLRRGLDHLSACNLIGMASRFSFSQ